MEDKTAESQADNCEDLTKVAERHPALDKLILAKSLSDKRQYLRKNAIIRQLLNDYPEEFSISDPEANGIVGLSHNPTKFKIHTITGNLPLALKQAADKEANVGRLLISLARAGSRAAAPAATKALVNPAARAMAAPAAQTAARAATPAAQSAGKRLADITGVTKFKNEEMITPFARPAGQATAGEKYLSNLAARGKNVNATGIQNAARFRTAIDSGIRAGGNAAATAGRYAYNSIKDPWGMAFERLPILNQLGAAVRGGTNYLSNAFANNIANPIGQALRGLGNKAFNLLPNQVAGMNVPKDLAKKTLSNTLLKAPSYTAYNVLMPHSVTGLASRGLAVEGARQGFNRVREGTDVANSIQDILYNNPVSNLLLTDEAKDHIAKHTGQTAGRSALGETYEGAKRLVNYGIGRELLPVAHDPISDALHKTLWESKGDMANKALNELGRNDAGTLLTRASPVLMAAHAGVNAVKPEAKFDTNVLANRMAKNLAIQTLKSPQDIAKSPTVRNVVHGLRSLLPKPTASVQNVPELINQQYPQVGEAVNAGADSLKNIVAKAIKASPFEAELGKKIVKSKLEELLKEYVARPTNEYIDNSLNQYQNAIPDLENVELLTPERQKKLQAMGISGLNSVNPELAEELGLGS